MARKLSGQWDGPSRTIGGLLHNFLGNFVHGCGHLGIIVSSKMQYSKKMLCGPTDAYVRAVNKCSFNVRSNK